MRFAEHAACMLVVILEKLYVRQVHNADDNFWKPVPDSAAEEGQLRHGPLF